MGDGNVEETHDRKSYNYNNINAANARVLAAK